MNLSIWRATLLVAQKELRTSFRDRQTVFCAVVVPLFLYPVLLLGLAQGAMLVQGRRERTEVVVGLAAAEPAQVPGELLEALASPPGQLAAPLAPERAPVRVVPATRPLDQEGARAWLASKEAGLDLVLWLASREAAARGERGRLYFDGSGSASLLARARVEERLAWYVEQARGAAARGRGRRAEELAPLGITTSDVAPGRDVLAYALSRVLPLLLVVTCVLGAFFPAVDLTAGEGERSTAETTLSLPVPRLAVHQGKILAVCAAALLATALNLGALGASAAHLLAVATGGAAAVLGEIPLLAFLSVAPLALLFAFFVSAVLVGVASFAGSFKEGQALLGPVQLAFLLPAMVGLAPAVELSIPLACIPVVNVVLAFRSLLLGEALVAEYAVTALSLCLAALVSMRLALFALSREGAGSAAAPGPLRRLSALARPRTHAR